MSTALVTLTNNLATRFGMGEVGNELLTTLKATAFKGPANEAQLIALMVVANQYNLNPWTREIYAFPDKNGGIVPVVGVDGWSRIINENSNFDGMEFKQDDESCTCIIHRKDRQHPITTTEYLSECRRDTQPWKSHPKRMLRHKSLIQCARLAFGYTGIYDQDEAERIAEIVGTVSRQSAVEIAEAAREPVSVDANARQNLIADLAIVASEQGIEAYAEAWKALQPAQRKSIGSEEHERLKMMASSIKAEVSNG